MYDKKIARINIGAWGITLLSCFMNCDLVWRILRGYSIPEIEWAMMVLAVLIPGLLWGFVWIIKATWSRVMSDGVLEDGEQKLMRKLTIVMWALVGIFAVAIMVIGYTGENIRPLWDVLNSY